MTAKAQGLALLALALAVAVGLGLWTMQLPATSSQPTPASPADEASPAFSTPTLPTGSATGPATSAGQAGGLLSLKSPAFSSTGIASQSNDADYDTAWTTPDEGWLAYDLSAIPVDQRRKVVVAWHTRPDDGYTVANGPWCPVWPGRQYPSDFTIETNAAAGGGAAPEDGWVEVASSDGNRSLSGQHLVEMGPHNWVRLSGSGPNGISINMEVLGAKDVEQDGWLFAGDSITAAYAGHATIVTSDGERVSSLTDLVAEGSDAQRRPAVQNNGTGCAGSSNAIDFIDPMLDSFHGKYVTVNFGGADGWGGAGNPESYYRSLETLVDKVRQRGMVPVVPTITWPNNGGAWEAGHEKLNDQIRRLYREHPEVLPGPDLYSLTKDRPELYLSAGDVHLNDDGSALVRKAWADLMVGVK